VKIVIAGSGLLERSNLFIQQKIKFKIIPAKAGKQKP